MTIHLDTSVLIQALTGPRTLAPALLQLVGDGARLNCATLVLYEWLRGPRSGEELRAQEELLPMASAVPFGALEALRAASFYVGLGRSRRRTVDLAIASCAIQAGAALWTTNGRDFDDVPGLALYRP